jgi:hypothetical protein
VRNAKLILPLVILLSVVASSLAAQEKSEMAAPKTVTVAAGEDFFITPGGGKTQIDLADYPLAKVFGGKSAGHLRVSLKGKPLDPNALGSVDTIVRRPKDIVLKGGRGSGALEIVALSLESEKPVSIGGESYNVHVGLSDTAKEPHPGRISLTLRERDGGTFSSSLPVPAKLVFTPEKGGQAVTIDCAAIPCGRGGKGIVVSDTATPWVISGGPRHFDPAALKIAPVKPGIRVGGEGPTAYTTVGSSNFYPGVVRAGQVFKTAVVRTQPHLVALTLEQQIGPTPH